MWEGMRGGIGGLISIGSMHHCCLAGGDGEQQHKAVGADGAAGGAAGAEASEASGRSSSSRWQLLHALRKDASGGSSGATTNV